MRVGDEPSLCTVSGWRGDAIGGWGQGGRSHCRAPLPCSFAHASVAEVVAREALVRVIANFASAPSTVAGVEG